MKNLTARILFAVALCAFSLPNLLADEIMTKRVSFHQAVLIGDKLFKKGTYKMEYNDATGELTVSKGKESVTTKAHLAKLDSEARETLIASVADGASRRLRSITFKGESRAFVLGASSQQANADQ